MSGLILAAMRGMTAYLNFSFFNNKTQDMILHLLIGALLMVVVLLLLKGLWSWIAQNKFKLTVFTGLVGFVWYFAAYSQN